MVAVSMNELIAHSLKPLLGATVKEAFLLVWPNEDGSATADTRLNIRFELKGGQLLSLTSRTGLDGQTPLLIEEDVANAAPYSALKQRQTVWADGVLDEEGSCHIEVFEITFVDEFGCIGNSTVKDIYLVFYTSSKSPAGIKFVFASGRSLWSVSAGDGNRVFAVLPENWFDEAMDFFQVT